MLVEIVVACVIQAGTLYTIPPGWRVEAVSFAADKPAPQAPSGETAITCAEDQKVCVEVPVSIPVEDNVIVMRKRWKTGDKITIPPGCAQGP